MNQKDINLFNKAIHTVKRNIVDIEAERKRYHRQLNKLMKSIERVRNSHDTKMKFLMNVAKEVLDEMYELFDDLYEEK